MKKTRMYWKKLNRNEGVKIFMKKIVRKLKKKQNRAFLPKLVG